MINETLEGLIGPSAQQTINSELVQWSEGHPGYVTVNHPLFSRWLRAQMDIKILKIKTKNDG